MGLRVRGPGRTQRRTFRSTIDGEPPVLCAAQALPGAVGTAPQHPGLVLTLHGAGVEAIGQARILPRPIWRSSHRPTAGLTGSIGKTGAGFDAIEVLELAQKALAADPRRTYLTGAQ